MLVDSHCHLDQFADADAELAAAAQAGVEQVVAVSESADSMRAVLALKRRYPDQVLAGLGLHPAWVTQATDAELADALAYLAAHLNEADVLGEVGLDYKWAASPEQQAQQQDVLAQQLDLAAQCSKPINLHSRRAQRQTLERAVEFRRRTKLNAQLHWFTQSKKLVRVCRAERIYVSVGPSVLCDPQTQAVVAEIDRELLLLETDAPVPIGGAAGHPARVAAVAAKLAELIGFTEEEAAANWVRYLGKPP